MEMNRRQLLQFFGIGATITPVVGGAPLVEAAAKLLAVPNVELLSADAFPDGHVPEKFAHRLKWNPYEAIWLYMWQIENNPPSCLNHGIGPLEHILGRDPTQAEKAAVAGLMQWFGSDCGHCFIEETLEACGYGINYKDNPHLRSIREIQHANLWQGSDVPPKVVIQRRGQRIELEYGNPGRVVLGR